MSNACAKTIIIIDMPITAEIISEEDAWPEKLKNAVAMCSINVKTKKAANAKTGKFTRLAIK